MKHLVLFLIFLTLFSCKKNKTKEELIAGKQYKYWVRTDIPNRNTTAFFYFDRNGNWKVFIKLADSTFGKLNHGDVFFYETWQLINDSVVDIGRREYEIKILNDSEFIFGDTLKVNLVSAPEHLIPGTFRKLQ